MKPIFYGWWMVAAGAGIQFIQAALIQQSFGAYVPVLHEDRGWSKTELSGAAALQSVEVAALAPLLGWVIDRFGSQGMIRIGVLVFGAGLMLLSLADSLLVFYCAFLVMALGTSLSGFFPLNTALIQWFEKKRARALSAMTLGVALGGMAVPAVAWSLTVFGWRPTAFGSGVIAIMLGWPLARMIRGRPENHGETVDGEPAYPSPTGAARPGAAQPAQDFTAREALRTPAFWLIALGHSFALIVVMGVGVHAISHMKEGLGYSIAAASLVITLLTLSQVGGILIGGTIGDRFDKRIIAAVCMLLHAAGLLFLTYATSTAMVVAFALMHGTAWGVRGPLMHAIRADYFGRRAIGTIIGLSMLILLVGTVSGPMIAGILADITGDYRAGFTILAFLAGLGSVFFLLVKRPVRPAREKGEGTA